MRDDDRERIIEAVADEIERSWLNGVETRPDATPFTAAIVDTARIGRCPRCCGQKRRVIGYDPESGNVVCRHPYHDARERMEQEVGE